MESVYNMNLNLGKKIKQRRQELGLTQKQLAEDICTQAQISNIEKGTLNPSSSALYLIGKKLKVDFNYFFDQTISSQQSGHFSEISKMIERLKAERNYVSIKYIIDNELSHNAAIYSKYEKDYLLWHRGITIYYIGSSINQSIEFLEDLISKREGVTTEKDFLLNISIYASIGAILKDEGEFKKAYQIYLDALEIIEKNRINKSEDSTIKIYIRILFGISQVSTQLHSYLESIEHITRAIDLCTSIKTLYLLADCYYQLGYNHIKLDNKNKGLESLEISSTLYSIEKNQEMQRLVLSEIRKIK
ncbi:helix-turn-helix domain-containing protein [Shouchella miscanthi]|uniref:Helix-turn-helix domain-containing protein n=1 Tax=Shouchella miscanthi TaxID=2598861 RepID=A0ABU6NKS3_9BACI|nr:helix-turn-helix domain-containing protein [Shouchella miscanthi]